MKMPTLRTKKSQSKLSFRDALFYAVSGAMLFVIWREAKATRAVLDESLEQQRQSEIRVQQVCEQLVAKVEKLEHQLQSAPEANTDAVEAPKKRAPRRRKPAPVTGEGEQA